MSRCTNAMQSKAVLLGNSGVGKTQFMVATFDDPTLELAALPRNGETATIGVDFRQTTRMTRQGEPFKLLIWDTAGQERFANLMPNYTRSSEGIALLFDTTDRASFDDLARRWLPLIDEHRQATGHDRVVCYLVANKIDLIDQRVVSQADGVAFAEAHHMIYAETTALRRPTVHRIINDMVQRIYDIRTHVGGAPRPVVNRTTVVVHNNASRSNKCCNR